MPKSVKSPIEQYADKIKLIYGEHLKQIILYGSYARGDYRSDSDIDIMILLDINDIEIKDYQEILSETTYDFNMDNETDIKPIAKNREHFEKWSVNYPFYSNICKEGKSDTVWNVIFLKTLFYNGYVYRRKADAGEVFSLRQPLYFCCFLLLSLLLFIKIGYFIVKIFAAVFRGKVYTASAALLPAGKGKIPLHRSVISAAAACLSAIFYHISTGLCAKI